MRLSLDPVVLGIIGLLVGVFIFLPIFARKHAMKRYLYYSNLEPVLANLGFLLQISGFFTLPSIVYAYYLNELSAAIALLITALVFLCPGFLLSFLFEPKMPNLKQSCTLLVLFFLFVPLINCIPFLYLGVFEGNLIDQILNSWFESSSAVSTTGLTLLEGVTMPKSVTLARGISEWGGGIGIIFMLLSSFYPSESLSYYARALGIEKITKDYKRSFLVVLLIYLVYTLIFSAVLVLLGLDSFTAFHTTFTIYSTTGLTVVNVLRLSVLAIIVITVMMLVSAFSFSFHLRFVSFLLKVNWKMLFKGNWRIFISSLSKENWKTLLTKEMKIYFILLLLFTLAFWHVTGLNPFRAFFHIIDFSTSVGLNLVPFEEIGEMGKIILVVVMLTGPCSFSLGGGIRILRLYILGKVLLALPRIFLTGEIPKVKVGESYLETSDIITHLLIVFLFISVSFLAALVLCNYGYRFVDALIESVSAITTTGDSPKTLTPSLPGIPKFLLIVLMLLGRIEIIPMFIVFSRVVESRFGH